MVALEEGREGGMDGKQTKEGRKGCRQAKPTPFIISYGP